MKIIHAIRRAAGRLTRIVRGDAAYDAPTRRYLAFNRAKWRRADRAGGEAVVLASLFAWNPLIHCLAHTTNHLARKHGARIEAFSFAAGDPARLVRLYESFGAAFTLGKKQAAAFQSLADSRAREIFRGLQSREELVALEVNGLRIGDLVYDTYLRYEARGTVDLRDERLLHHLRDALLIFFASEDYLARHRVVAVIPDHVVYIHCGILVRLAARAGVPVYNVYYSPEFYVVRLECGAPAIPIRWPWWRYHELFAQLPPARREAGIARGRASLEARMTGTLDPRVLAAHSAYGVHEDGRLLVPSERPKILVMLHDFCDAVHVLRHVIFDDFSDWIRFLLTRAAATPFDWYVKPHPNTRDSSRASMNATNDALVAELRRDFPGIHFLPAAASNRQLIDEGIRALFTVYGTAGHEFAYLGVPVVNAGDNPHIGYRFNFHPETRDELAALIARADRLELPMEKRDIEEYHYMNHYFFPEELGSGVQLVEPSLNTAAAANCSEVFDAFIAADSAENDARLTAYFAGEPGVPFAGARGDVCSLA